jgi:transcriptional regulator with XRE-family HTH domain
MPKLRRTPTDVEVGRRLRLLRLERKLSQQRVADGLGITFQQVQKYENGTNRISAGRLARLSEIFGVPISHLFGKQDLILEEPKVFGLLKTASALRLLKAYSQIKRPAKRRALVKLAESMTGE